MHSTLSLETAKNIAPSIGTTYPIEGASSKYQLFSTESVLERLLDSGWNITQVQEQRIRTPENRPFTKHLIRLRQPHEIEIGADVPEVVLINSHNAKTALQFMLGVFRMVCTNGLITGNPAFHYRLIHHTKNANEFDRILNKIPNDMSAMMYTIGQMKQTHLHPTDIQQFVSAAARIRWGNELPKKLNVINLSASRRKEDNGRTVWQVYNRTQENLIRGGITGMRKLTGLTSQVKLNQKLWTLAENYLPVQNAS